MLNPNRLSDLLLGPGGLAQELVYLNLYFQGEPYLHPGMDDLVRVGKKAKLYVSTTVDRRDQLELLPLLLHVRRREQAGDSVRRGEEAGDGVRR